MVSFCKEIGEYAVDHTLFNHTYEVDTPQCSAKELDEFNNLQSKIRNHGKEMNELKKLFMMFTCRLSFFNSRQQQTAFTFPSPTRCSVQSSVIDQAHNIEVFQYYQRLLKCDNNPVPFYMSILLHICRSGLESTPRLLQRLSFTFTHVPLMTRTVASDQFQCLPLMARIPILH